MKKLLCFILLAFSIAAVAPVTPFKVTAVDTTGVRVSGDPAEDYAVEYSTDLQNWITIALVKGDGKVLVPNPNPRRTGYFRARLGTSNFCSPVIALGRRLGPRPPVEDSP